MDILDKTTHSTVEIVPIKTESRKTAFLLHDMRGRIAGILLNFNSFTEHLSPANYHKCLTLFREIVKIPNMSAEESFVISTKKFSEMAKNVRFLISRILINLEKENDFLDPKPMFNLIKVLSSFQATLLPDTKAETSMKTQAGQGVNEYIMGVVSALKEQYEDFYKNLTVELKVCVKDEVCFHPESLQRLIENLVLNAVQARNAKNSHIKISLSNKRVSDSKGASLPQKGYYYLLEIFDNGMGISPENLILMARSRMTTKKNGSGLGLLSVRDSLVNNGARMYIESKKGVYTRVSVFFPVKNSMRKKLSS